MPIFLDTRGRSTLGIGVCARCGIKMSLDELMADPNSPGLRVCKDDIDEFDPYRLPARETEDITLEYPRPDFPIDTEAAMPVYANEVNNISAVLPNQGWTASTAYLKGATVTPVDPNNQNVPLPLPQFMALNAGTSGAVAPNWPLNAGQEIADGTITWLGIGIWVS